jgi:hypothetical protein
MNKKIKIILVIASAVILIIAGTVINGLRLMSIEDYYGDNQDFYFKSKQGDLILNTTNHKTGFVIKSWTRINALVDNDTVDFNTLLEANKVEILRANQNNKTLKHINNIIVDSLLRIGDLELIMKN